MKIPDSLQPDPFELRSLPESTKRRFAISTAALVVGVLLALAPQQWLDLLGTVPINGEPYGPVVVGLATLALLAGGTRLLWEASQATSGRRPMAVALGLVIASLSGNGLRAFLELAVLRHGWRPDLVVAEPFRALPLMWIWLAGLVHLAGFVVGSATALAAAMPRRLLAGLRLDQHTVVERLGALLTVIPILYIGLLMIGSWALGPDLLRALGTAAAAAEGPLDATRVEVVFFGVWPGLASLSIVQLLVGFWGAIELTRLVDHTLPDRLRRQRLLPVLVWASVAAALVAAVVLARSDLWGGIELSEDAGVRFIGFVFNDHVVRALPLLLLGALCVALPLCAAAVLLGLHDGDRDGDGGRSVLAGVIELWPSKSSWVPQPEVLVIIPIAALLLFDVGVRFVWVIATSLTGPARFLEDRSSFYDFWSIISFSPHYADVDLGHVVGPALALIFGISILLIPFDSARAVGLTLMALCGGIMVLTPTLDETITILALYVGFVVSCALVLGYFLEWTDWYPAVLRVGALCAAMMVFQWLPDAPAAALLAGTFALRFLWQSGALNEADERRERRINLTMGFSLVLTGLVLAQSNSPLSDTQAFGTVGQAIALPFVALPLAIAMFAWRRSQQESSAGILSN